MEFGCKNSTYRCKARSLPNFINLLIRLINNSAVTNIGENHFIEASNIVVIDTQNNGAVANTSEN